MINLIPYFFSNLSCIEYDIQEKTAPTVETGEEETGIIEPIPPLDCSVTKLETSDIDQNQECTTSEYNIENPWNVEVSWQWQGLLDEPFINQVMMHHVDLNDDDGDGCDRTGHPDVVVVVFDSRDGTAGDQGCSRSRYHNGRQRRYGPLDERRSVLERSGYCRC